ncbi:MAG: chitobiase/beta-hexosaminidase C-terminal domain-containing protein, partial [Muribaculaceae bacterium]|nr:chitobiase/beta-hexosaminidase C-terminal domain-containing protein [Muribaculaceae bacterium]
YTTDGTEPTTASTLFTTAVEINADMTIKAIAVKEGMANSSVTTAVYTVKVVDENIATFNFAAPETLTPAYPATIDGEGLTNESGNKSATITGKYFTVGNVAVSNTKGSSTDAKIYYQSSGKIQLRVYTGGSTTIQSTDPDNNIVKIVFTYNNGKTSYDKVTAPTEGTWTANEGTWTGDAQSVTFNYSGNIQINQIEVTCANGITEGSEITGPEEPKAVEVASIAEWLTANADIASGKDSEKSYKFTCPLTVARQLTPNLYVTDGTDWMLIYDYNMPAYNNGDVIPAGVEGVFSNFSGLPELKPVLATLAEATPGTAIEPTVTTLATFSDLGKNAYIKLNNVNIT